MSKIIHASCAALIGLAVAGLGVSAASAQTPSPDPAAKAQPARLQAMPKRECFSLSDWHGWSSPSRDVLYMKVRYKDVYRLDLQRGTIMLQSPGTHLVNVVRGTDRVCHPLDLDLRVSDGFGMPLPIRAKAITKLTPEEIAAIPKRDRP